MAQRTQPFARNAGHGGPVEPSVIVRDAHPEELTGVGDLRVAAYLADGFLPATSGYAPILRALTGDVLVAVEGDRILGTVTLRRWPDEGEILRGPGEAEIRALAVDAGARGQGIGAALVTAVIERAARHGVQRLLLLTLPEMRAAHHLYNGAGFRRMPDRDWSPRPGAILLAYGLSLTP
jgi:ribosomal protein S18 acetylase RimI-like enzyme